MAGDPLLKDTSLAASLGILTGSACFDRIESFDRKRSVLKATFSVHSEVSASEFASESAFESSLARKPFYSHIK